MDLILIQTAPCDTVATLKDLASGLPQSLRDRVTDLDARPVAPEDLPRVVIRLPEASAADEAQIATALKTSGGAVFELGRNTLSVPVAAPPAPPLTLEAFPWLPEPPARARGESDLEQRIAAVFQAKPSGQPFPEETYDEKYKKAYDEVVRQLGRAPCDDRGKILKPSDLDRVKRPARKRIDRTAWDGVVAHLRDEVQFFHLARGWFDASGHLRVILRDQMFLDMGFMKRLNDRYGLIKKTDTQAQLQLDVAMAVAGKIVGVASPLTAFVLGQLWGIAKAQHGSGAIDGAIRDMEDKLFAVYESSIQGVEGTMGKLLSDWGNLQTFGKMVLAEELDWPDDASGIRRAHLVGYHTACLRSLMKLKSDTESGKSGMSTTTWGVVEHIQGTSKAVKRHFTEKTGILSGKSSDPDCLGGRWYPSYYFGWVHSSAGSGYGPTCDVKRAPAALAAKMFGSGEGAADDPHLGIPDTFLDDPKVRKAWGLHSVRVKHVTSIS